jgi:regulator of sigma D
MEDTEILNQGDAHPDEQDIAEFILDHDSLYESQQMLVDIAEHIAAVDGFSIATEGIALEGIGETIKAYWEKFVAFLKKIWEKIVKFFELHFTTLGRQRLHINRMMKKVKAISTNPGVYQHLEKGQRPFTIPEYSTQSFIFNNRPVTKYEELVVGLEKTNEAVKLVTEGYSKYIANRGTVIGKALQAAKGENAQGILARVTEELTHQGFSHSPAYMLGNVEVKYGAESEAGDNALDSHRLVLIQNKAPDHVINFQPMKITELAKVYESMEAILNTIDAFKDGEYKTIVEQARTMMASTEQFVKAVGSGDGSEGSVAAYRQLMDLNKHYLNWIKAPTTDLIRFVTETFFYVSREAEHNIHLFEERSARNLFTVLGLMP